METQPESGFDLLQPDAIREALAAKGFSEYVLLYASTTNSTNADVLAHFDQQAQLAIAICEMQTAGKGRRGRQWYSPYARNIYCTVGVEKSLPASHLGLLSILSGIALCEALADCGIEGVRLKWPNDLYFQKKKLGGILIESKPAANGRYFLAIGFGLNVHMTQRELDDIPQAATSLDLIQSETVNRQLILLAAIERVLTRIQQFEETQVAALIDDFQRHDAFYAQKICVLNADEEIFGINSGINQYGQLKLQTDQGLAVFSAAEISMRGVG